MNGPTGIDWTSGLLVLAVGLVLGTVLVWKVLGRARGQAPVTATPSPEALVHRDLEAERDVLLAQLRELEDTSSKRTDEQLARERYALELKAARATLALDAVGPLVAPLAAAPVSASASASASASQNVAPGPGSDKAALRGFLWGTLSAGALGLLFFFLYNQARPRKEGGSLTGELPARPGMGASSAPAAPGPGPGAIDPDEARIREAVARNPDDIEAHMALARLLLSKQNMMGVWNETKLVLERAPGHPQALAYQALVRLAMGQGDKAVEMLQESIRRDPDLVDSYVHMALVYVRLGRSQEAQDIVAQAARRFPQQAASLNRLLQELQQGQAMTEQVPAGEADPHASLGTPGGAGQAQARAAASGVTSAKRIAGTVELDPSLVGQVGSSGVLFVFVREAGFGAGPPIAARRLPVSSFPVTFEIGEADAMMGQPFPDDLLVEARLDADGDPTTRPPTDPKARVDEVKAGSTTVRLVLKRS